MDRPTYRRLYDALATLDDVHRISHDEHRDEELLFVIHTHRVTRDATRRFYPVQHQLPRVLSEWKRGRSMLDISHEWRFPPVLAGQIIMKGLGVPRKQVWGSFLHPESAPDARLRHEVEELLSADMIYSPRGMELQRERGIKGEDRLYRWLEKHGIGYRTEKDLRGKFQKTPDALLDDPIVFLGQKITWIESKANFGDDVELRKNLKRQLGPYTEIFGEGAVVYWYGYIEEGESPPGILLWDADQLEGLTPVVQPRPAGSPVGPPSRGHAPRPHHEMPPAARGSERGGHAGAPPP